MMMYEPKCISWKRLGTEQIQAKIEKLTLEEELAFWKEQTTILKEMQQKAQSVEFVGYAEQRENSSS